MTTAVYGGLQWPRTSPISSRWPGAGRDAAGGVVLLQAAVALAGDDDGCVWWPAVAQHESDQLATHGSGEEEEARVRVRVRHVWRGAGRGIVCGGRPAQRAATSRTRMGPRGAALGSAAGRAASERQRTCEQAGARHKRNVV